MTMLPDHTTSADDEIDLLDLLVTLAENIKLLTLGPLLAGLLALGTMWAWPITHYHESSFTLQGKKTVGENERFTPAQVKQLVTNPDVIADTTKALQSSGQSDSVVLLQSGAVTSQIPRNTTHVQVIVKSQDIKASEAVAQALLKSILDNSRIKGDAKLKIEAELKKDQQSLDQVRVIETRLSQNLIVKDGLPDLKQLQTYQSLVSTADTILDRIKTNQNLLVGLEDADIITPPSLLSTTSSPKLKHVLVISVLATCFALLLYIFARQAFRNASATPESAVKIARIRKALGFKVDT